MSELALRISWIDEAASGWGFGSVAGIITENRETSRKSARSGTRDRAISSGQLSVRESFAELRVEDKRDRSVVDERDLHDGAKGSAGDRSREDPRELAKK